MLSGITLEQLRADADHGPLRKMVLLNGIALSPVPPQETMMIGAGPLQTYSWLISRAAR
jgi:hypothetical protein